MSEDSNSSPGYRSASEFKLRRDAEREGRELISKTLGGVRWGMNHFANEYPLASDVTIDPVDAGGVPAEWVRTPDSSAERVVLYIHGGCFISGSPATVRECCSRVARAARARVLSVDYRLAPEHPYPAALDDVLRAYAWLLEQGVSPQRIVIAGESAGGGLTFSMLMRIRDEGRLPLPALGVPISPWIDMTLTHETLTRNVGRDLASVIPLHIGAKEYVAGQDPRDPYLSPLFGDLKGLPPLLIQIGGAEVLLDDGIAIAHKARRSGVDVRLEVWPEMVHVWHWFATELEDGEQAIEAIGTFIRSRLP